MTGALWIKLSEILEDHFHIFLQAARRVSQGTPRKILVRKECTDNEEKSDDHNERQKESEDNQSSFATVAPLGTFIDQLLL